MTSLRHIPPSESTFLDAARACILDVGWRRTTLTEVARRAGVSRMTIYRTWADMPTLLGDLMTREWMRIVATNRTGDAFVGADSVEGLVERVVTTIRALRHNELYVRIVELDPELVLPYLLSRRGRSQDHVLRLTERAIADGRAAGLVRAGDPATMARALVLAAHGFVLSSHTMLDDDVDQDALDAELTLLLTRALVP
jgi:AcrR family transcriptional regulator